MRNIIIVIFLIIISFLAYSQKKYTLEECIDIAFTSNRSIKQAELILTKSKIELKDSRNKLLPSINAEANQNWNFGQTETEDGTLRNINSTTSYIGFNSSMQLFDGLKSIYEIKFKRNETNIADAKLLFQKQQIRDEVTNSYLKILLNKELRTTASTQLQLTDTLIAQRNILFGQGRIAQGELLELYAQRAKEEFQYIQSTNNLIISKLDLMQLLEIEYDSLFDISNLDENMSNIAIFDSEFVYKNAMSHRANIKSAELDLKGSKLNSNLIKSAYFPNLTTGIVSGKNYFDGYGTPFSTKVYISATVPIFDKFQTKNHLQRNKVQVMLAELSLTNEKKELYKLIEQAKYNSLAAKAKWESAVKAEKISLESYNYLKSKYNNGKATTFELYQSKTNHTVQISAALQAKYEFIFQQKMIQNLMN